MSAPELIRVKPAVEDDHTCGLWVEKPDSVPGGTEYIRKDASDAAIAAARAEGVREGMLKAAGYADNWLATFGQAAIKHTPAQEYACDAVADIADAIRAAAEAQP